ncbi:MAG: glycosyltransferase [Neomegalonema sp.]|nr:glycosyltransferase [Neomegalonema sp.]
MGRLDAPQTVAPRYSVVIPTRNRAETCVHAVRTILAAQRKDVEIILADASDDPTRLKRALEQSGLDGPVILPPPGRPLPMQENWERGLAAAHAPWVIFIGDDDGMLPNAFAMLDALTDAPVAPVVAWEPIDYRWPCYPGGSAGQLTFSTEAPSLSLCEGEKALTQHFAWSTRRKWPAIGPSIYHGAVHRDLIQRVKNRHGRYFSSFIVDYASAIANAAEIRAYLRYTGPLSILGASGKSNSAGLSASGEAAKRYEDVIAENPGLTPLHEGLAQSRLHAPLVASGYAASFQMLGATFTLSPERMLVSCADELGCIVDAEAFERERRVLMSFAEAAGVSDAPARQARFAPATCGVGFDRARSLYFVNSTNLNWRTVADVAAGAGAFIQSAAIPAQSAYHCLTAALKSIASSEHRAA